MVSTGSHPLPVEPKELPMSAGASAYLVIRRDDGFGGLSMKKRLRQTWCLTPQPATPTPSGLDAEGENTVAVPSQHSVSRDLALLYRLALDMGSCTTYEELARVVLDGLLEAVPAE